MSENTSGHHGRRLAAVVAGVLALAAVMLVIIGVRGQDHAATPPASAAHTAAEGNLPAPSTSAHASTTAPDGKSSKSSPAAPSTVGPVLARSKPTDLTIPAIGIKDSHLATYGTGSQGEIAVPPATGGVPAGWYTGSPAPGQLGPSVIVGHTDAERDSRSIFFRLGQLRPGDTIQVTRADHTVATFKVDSLENYPKASFPTQTVYGNINHSGLRLISCIGKFDTSTGHYLDNIVVYAHLISSHHT